ncbi:MAG: hypothetical protein MJE77_19940 [Proteobacteria bacterium]|nr:hypothetical protein [Pseudomonadota bacterium]
MKSIRKLTHAVAVLAALSFATAGCSKDKKEDKASGDKAEAARSSSGSKSGFAIMPKDSNAVGGINVAKIVSSNLWKQYGTMAQIRFANELQKFKNNCNMDPFTAIESVIVAANAEENKPVIVVKGLSRSDAIPCAKKMAEAENKQLTITEEGKITKAVDATDTAMHIGWLDDKTMVVVGEGKDKAAVETVLAGQSGLDQNAEMMDLLGNVDTGSAVWGVGRNTTGNQAGPISGKALYSSVSLDGGLKIDAGIRQGSADEAKATAEKMSQYTAFFAGSPMEKFAKKAQFKTNNQDVIFQLSLSDAEVTELIGLIMTNPDIIKMAQRFGGM